MNDQPRKRLLRSTDDRVLAGVAGGLARYLDIDPTLVRVGFVIASLFGGLGIVAYLVLAVVTPRDDGSGAPAQGDRPSAWLVVLAVLAVLVLFPGPFWGPFHWWGGWWWGGGLWLLLLAGGGVWLYMTVRDRDDTKPRPSEGAPAPKGESAEAATAPTGALPAASPDAGGRRDRTRGFLRALAIALLVLAAACVACTVAVVSAWATATGQGAIVAGVVIAIGVALAVAAFSGEARWRWLIVPALVLALPAGAVAATDVSFDAGIGERQHRPVSIADVPEDGYSLGVGQLIVDLRALPWRGGQSVDLNTDLGVGQTVVSVPSRVCVEADARTSIGEVLVRGQSSAGVDPEVVERPPEGGAPRLVLDSDQDVGQVVVGDRPPEELERNEGTGGWHGDEGSEQERLEAQRACAR